MAKTRSENTQNQDDNIVVLKLNHKYVFIDSMTAFRSAIESEKIYLENMIVTYDHDIDYVTQKLLKKIIAGGDLSVDEYKQLKSNSIHILEKVLKRASYYQRPYWEALNAGLYFIIALIQLMEAHYFYAQLNFDEVLLTTKNDSLYATTVVMNLYTLSLRFKTDLDKEKFSRVAYRYLQDEKLKKLIDSKNHSILNFLYSEFDSKIKADLNNRASEIANLSAAFREWKNTKEIGAKTELLSSPYFYYFKKDNLLLFFSYIFINVLNEYLKTKEQNLIEAAAFYATHASEVMSLHFFISEVLKTISRDAEKRYAQTSALKLVLEVLKEKKLPFYSLYDVQDVDSILSRMAPENLIEPFKITLLEKPFIEKVKALAAPILRSMASLIATEHKTKFYNLIDQFQSSNASKLEQTKKDCNQLITSFGTQTGPISNILYFIKGVASLDEKALNEVLYQPFNTEIKNLLHLVRAYLRCLMGKWAYATFDLDQIKDMPASTETEKALKEFNILKNAIKEEVLKNEKIIPLTEKDFLIDLEFKVILHNLQASLLMNDYDEAFHEQVKYDNLRERCESYHLKKIYLPHGNKYYFLMIILLFKMRLEVGNQDSKNICGELLLIYLQEILVKTFDPPNSLLKLEKRLCAISKGNEKTYLSLFQKDYQRLPTELQSTIFNHRLDAYSKELTDEKKETVVETAVPVIQPKQIKNAPNKKKVVRQTEKQPPGPNKIENKKGEEETKTAAPNEQEIVLVPQLSSQARRDLKKLEDLKNYKESLKSSTTVVEAETNQPQSKQKITPKKGKTTPPNNPPKNDKNAVVVKNKVLETQNPKPPIITTKIITPLVPSKAPVPPISKPQPKAPIKVNPRPPEENAWLRLKAERLKNKNIQFLDQHFTPEEKSFLCDIAKKWGIQYSAYGSLVTQGYLLYSGDEERAKSVKPSDIDLYAIKLSDIDIDDHTFINDLKSHGFGDIKNDQSKGYINLKKPLKGGMVLDLTLRSYSAPITSDFPISGGNAFINFSENPLMLKFDEKHPDFINFTNACKHWSTDIRLPGPDTKSFGPRLWKCLKRYEGIEIRNRLEALTALFDSYSAKNISAFLELRDFVRLKNMDIFDDQTKAGLFKETFSDFFKTKLNLDTTNDTLAVMFVKLAFAAVFSSRGMSCHLLHGCIKSFVVCKDNLYYENLEAFLKQMETLVQHYLPTANKTSLPKKLQHLKFLYQTYDALFDEEGITNVHLSFSHLIKCCGYAMRSQALNNLVNVLVNSEFSRDTAIFFEQMDNFILSNCNKEALPKVSGSIHFMFAAENNPEVEKPLEYETTNSFAHH